MSREVYCHRCFPETAWKDFLLVKGWKRAAPDLHRIARRNPWRATDIAGGGVLHVSNAAAAANEGKSESAAPKLPARGQRHGSVTLRGSFQHIWERAQNRGAVTHQLPSTTAYKNANAFQTNTLWRVCLFSGTPRFAAYSNRWLILLRWKPPPSPGKPGREVVTLTLA